MLGVFSGETSIKDQHGLIFICLQLRPRNKLVPVPSTAHTPLPPSPKEMQLVKLARKRDV